MIPFIAGIPVGVFSAALLSGFLALADGRGTVTGFERLAAVLLLGAAITVFLRKPPNRRGSYAFASTWTFIPLACASAYYGVYSLCAYDGLFLGDSDFTNMSEAIRSSAAFEGLLATPYLATGPSGSYLAHHFSPGLFLFLPFYWGAKVLALLPSIRPTHAVYAFALWFYFSLGLLLWGLVVRRRVQSGLAQVVLTTLLAVNVLSQRLVQSFHFEVLVIPVSAAVFMFEGRSRPAYFLALIFWLSLKEDMALYVALLGIFQITSPMSRKQGIITVLLAVACAVGSLSVQRYLGQAAVPDWPGYWRDTWGTTRSLRPSLDLLIFLGLLPLLAPKRFLLLVLPVMAIQFLSLHPWHKIYYGHYSYAILPFALIASIEGAGRMLKDSSSESRWRPALIVALGAVVLFGASMDRETPGMLFPSDARRTEVDRILRSVAPGACVAAHIAFSGRVPLDLRVFPLFAQPGNPFGGVMNPAAPANRHHGGERCRGRVWLFDVRDPKPPYYDAAALARLDRELSGKARCSQPSLLRCYLEGAE